MEKRSSQTTLYKFYPLLFSYGWFVIHIRCVFMTSGDVFRSLSASVDKRLSHNKIFGDVVLSCPHQKCKDFDLSFKIIR